jgi:hypothetical protein
MLNSHQQFRTFEEAPIRLLLAVEFDRRRVLRRAMTKLKYESMRRMEEYADSLIRVNAFIARRFFKAWMTHVAKKRDRKTLLAIRVLALVEGSFRMWKAWVHHRAIDRIQTGAVRCIRRKSIVGRHFYLWKARCSVNP